TRAAEIDDAARWGREKNRHSKVFEILGASFDESDHFFPSETPDLLAKKLAAVGEVFLPRALRRRATAGNPLGSGGSVWVSQGKEAGEKLELFDRILDDAGFEDRIKERALSLGRPISEMRIAIKPTFMLGYHRKDLSV